jgi:23S rRNA pseudouridine1911/1915/1917 synthase
VPESELNATIPMYQPDDNNLVDSNAVDRACGEADSQAPDWGCADEVEGPIEGLVEDLVEGHTHAKRDLVERDLVLDAADTGRRLDQVLATRLPEFSRGRIQGWIEAGMVRVDGVARRARDRMHGGEHVALHAVLEPVGRCEPEPVELDVVFEDEHLLVIDKPAGLVVHPAAGNWHGTLQNGLLHREPALDRLPRCGIVHRLDKDTSGLLVVARTPLAHQSLTEQLRARTVKREYRALVVGELAAGGRVDAPIGRHPTRRTSMAVVAGGRASITDYRVLARYSHHSLLAVQLLTGRTHQIRVHMAHIGHPLVGDPVYGGRPPPTRGLSEAATDALREFPRQALHAVRLGLLHPAHGEPVSWEVPMAADLARLLDCLESE